MMVRPAIRLQPNRGCGCGGCLVTCTKLFFVLLVLAIIVGVIAS